MSGDEPAVARMARDIARQFGTRPAEEAAEAIAKHMNLFWEPRMRAELLSAQVRACLADDPLLTRVLDQVSVPETSGSR